ncbi:bacteriocin immunity protein [Enterobacter roggenkampii]|uniref:bacteriocin immunity protein n=1 Tax=Enterobacter roggenkampii TaxID=1812935 RepID=UPI002237E7CC|nr:bacteriocin immunity protein [Enterobacter roggenkampii]MCW5004334.1 bacteriocin immunity protein [Enterobacter roggenkampii]
MININCVKDRLEGYTKNEFMKILNEFYSEHRSSPSLKGDELEIYLDNLLDILTVLVGIGEVSDFIYYPDTPENDLPEGALNEVIKWRKSQGLPLFKDSQVKQNHE